MYYRRLKSILFCVLLLSSLISCAAKDNKLTINTKQDNFTVTLPANPTTGFQWSVVEYDKNIFELINKQYITSNVGLIGAGGNTLFTFKLKKQSSYPGFSIIKFKYSRSWEPESGIYKNIKIIIKS